LRGDERIDMTHTPDIKLLDEQPDPAARVQRRMETAEAALAMFDGDRLALIAALARQSRAARNASPGEQPNEAGAESARPDPTRHGRPATASRPLLVID
jgi:hypothetical protein